MYRFCAFNAVWMEALALLRGVCCSVGRASEGQMRAEPAKARCIGSIGIRAYRFEAIKCQG